MIIDLRSDTVTRPTAGMLDAMFQAEVGDDVFGEDPAVNALEAKAAGLFGHEAGLFCPSGTMTNQIAINVHTRPGDEVICEQNSHIYHYEGGGISRNSGVQARLVEGNRGRMTAAQVEASVNGNFDWLARTRLVSVENTANRAGGSYYDIASLRQIRDVTLKHNLACHLDGARIFNALIASGQTALQIGACFDSVSVCLSKGLGAPAGSVLLGSRSFIAQARRVRKVFGGGMRQAGYLAAAGIYALDNHIARLAEDHARAAVLADTLASLPYVKSQLPTETNIVIFSLHDNLPVGGFLQYLEEQGIKAVQFGPQTVRFVTHLDFNDAMLDETVQVLKSFSV
ncbi:MAG: threonine aldolase [Bacteroidetes bacterium]|nr:threonine aldolase [Bacteroidota bacterium]